jgi:hypothetical protein
MLAYQRYIGAAALLYEDYIGDNADAFKAKVVKIADNLGIDPNWLMLIMKNESNIDPQAVNKKSGASGLIQFMPSTIAAYNVPIAAFRAMSNVDQLDYVEKFFQGWKNLPFEDSAFDTYLTVFYAKAIGQPDSYVIAKAGTPTYDQNAALDANNDGVITKGDFRAYLINKYPDQASWFASGSTPVTPQQPAPSPAPGPATPTTPATNTAGLPSFGSFFPNVPVLANVTWVEVGVGAIILIFALQLKTSTN